ncbi:MAG: hypothetical protein AAGF84_08775 [Planctomycetota bacterium]
MPDEPRRLSPAGIARVADRYRVAMLGVATAVFVATCTLRWRPGNDSAEMLVIARRLNDIGQFRTLGGYHEGVMPGYPWLLALLGRLGDAVTLAIALNAAAFVAWVAFVFLWVRAHFDRATAVVVAGLCAISARTLEASADVLPGMLFATLLAALMWWEAKPRRVALRFVGVGVLLLAMFSLRSVCLLVAAAWLVSGGSSWLRVQRDNNPPRISWRRGAVLLGVAALSCVGLSLVPALRKDIAALWKDWSTNGLSGIAETMWEALISGVPEAILGIDPTPFAGPLLSILAAMGLVLLFRRCAFGALVAVTLALPWFFYLAVPRYVVPVLPMLYLGLWLLVLEMVRRWPGKQAGLALAFGLLVVGNLVGVGRFVYEQRQPRFLETYRDGRFATSRAASDWLAEHTTRGTRVICTTREKAVLSFWSGRAVLDTLSTPAVNAGRLLMVEPVDDAFVEAMAQRGWSASTPMVTFEAPEGEPTWTLHEVVRP